MTEPYWDQKIQSMIVKETDEWIVSITPMIFNDRVLLTHKERDYPYGWTAGWCYDKGGAAMLAAMAWDPGVEREPLGYKKVAGDARHKENDE
jgi:hypothetical protein